MLINISRALPGRAGEGLRHPPIIDFKTVNDFALGDEVAQRLSNYRIR